MHIPSFRNFKVLKEAGYPTREALSDPVTIIGGFIVGQDKTSFQEAVDPVMKIPILFDEDDIKFLLQFPPRKYQHAIWWRYGEGLKKASGEFYRHGKCKPVDDVAFKSEDGETVFK